VHEHLIEAGKVTLLQVQADEIWVKAVGRIYWLASALEVRSRLWLGAVTGGHRDAMLIRSLLERIRRSGPPEHWNCLGLVDRWHLRHCHSFYCSLLVVCGAPVAQSRM
jgi:hypothetical protein